jgi:hypothetical protein
MAPITPLAPTGAAAPGVPAGPALSTNALIRQAADSLRQAEQKLSNGDWTGFGTAMNRLRQALNRLEGAR